jgi:alanine racemase
MLIAALAGEKRVTGSPQSFNSQVGVALSLLSLDPEAEIAIIECGISQPGEMDRLERLVRPHCGILTNIGDAHLEGLQSRENTAREKVRLFRRLGELRPPLGWVVLPLGEWWGRHALEQAEIPYRAVGEDASGVELPVDEHAPPYRRGNAALAAAAALRLGATPEGILRGLAEWQPPPMRLEYATTPRGVLLINDAYTSDPTSVEAALATLAREGGSESRGKQHQTIAVLGGMAQLGAMQGGAHRAAGQRTAELGVDRLIGVGPGGGEIATAALEAGMAPEAVHVAVDVAEAAALLEEHCRPGDRVLLKGSRPERLERIASLLFDSVASARLYVDLDALVENFRTVRRIVGRQAGPAPAVMAVVKSFGYGLDSVRIARALERAGCDAFVVAYPDEGVELRDRGITAPILVQNVLVGEVDKVVRYGLTAAVVSEGQVLALAAEAAAQQRAVRVHLKIDTGMGRAGIFEGQAVELARRIEAEEWLTLEGLMTHFAAAEDPAHDAFTADQIDRFDAVRTALAEAGIRVRWEHAANSAGLDRFPRARYSMVRTGLALFGYSVTGLAQRPILRLTTRVVSVKELPPGHPVGYGLTFTTPTARHIAVVALGYTDGYPWSLSNRGWMAVHGKRCPVVGRVSMDVTMVDVTDLIEAGEEVQPGDEVVVFGPDPGEPSLPALARLAETIPYELLTRISPRVRRIYRASHG